MTFCLVTLPILTLNTESSNMESIWHQTPPLKMIAHDKRVQGLKIISGIALWARCCFFPSGLARVSTR